MLAAGFLGRHAVLALECRGKAALARIADVGGDAVDQFVAVAQGDVGLLQPLLLQVVQRGHAEFFLEAVVQLVAIDADGGAEFADGRRLCEVRDQDVARQLDRLAVLRTQLDGRVAGAVLGLLLVLRPLQGVLTLTIVLAVIFAIEGFGAILISLDFRRHLRNWGWTLFSGIVDFVLVYLIWQGWPDTAAWAIGLLVGINMFFFGLALTMTAIAARAMKGD